MSGRLHQRFTGKVETFIIVVDADLCGGTDSTRSTSGMLLVLAGPNSWFPKSRFPLCRSITESEY